MKKTIGQSLQDIDNEVHYRQYEKGSPWWAAPLTGIILFGGVYLLMALIK